MEFVVWFLVEACGELLLELLLEIGLSGYKEVRGRPNRDPVLATIGYFALGAALGGASLWLFPDRILAQSPRPGLSLLLSPVAAGLVMGLWGRHRRGRGRPATNLATWHGGGALALGVALVRFLWVGR